MRILGFLVVAVLLSAGGVWMFLDTIVKSGTETFGSKLTGTQVNVASVHISLLKGHAVVEGLSVANPAGFSEGDAVKLGKIEVKLVPASVLSDRIRVEKVNIDSPAISYEMSEKGTNIDTIMGNIAKFTGSQNAAPAQKTAEAAPAKAPAHGKKVQIDRVEIKNTKVAMGASLAGKGGKASFDVPEIILKDIGAQKDGATLAEAVQQVMTPIMGSVAALSTQDVAKMKEKVMGIKDDITTGLKGIGSSIKSMFGTDE
ncbi:MAG: hypothetical protein GC134_05485 [Proteobacteria bacterium]|nr:hypothetical protein [Pseudomonadota bacterium]